MIMYNVIMQHRKQCEKDALTIESLVSVVRIWCGYHISSPNYSLICCLWIR